MAEPSKDQQPLPQRPRKRLEEQMLQNLKLLRVFRTLQNSFIFAPFLVLFLLQLNFTPFQALLITVINSTWSGLLEIPTGYLADTFGRKRSLVIGSFLSAIGFGLFTTAHSFGTWAIAAAIVTGTGGSLVFGAEIALTWDSGATINDLNRVKKMEGAMAGIAGLAEATASLIGLGLLPFIGLHGIMWLQAGTYLLMTFLALRMTETTLHVRAVAPSFSELRQIGFSLFKRQRRHLAAIIVFGVGISALTYLMVWPTALYAEQVVPTLSPIHGWQPTMAYYPAYWAALLLSVWIFALIARWRHRGGHYQNVGRACRFMVIIGLISYDLIAPVWWVGLVAYFGLYWVRANQIPLMNNLINEQTAGYERATIASIKRSLQWLFIAGVGVASSYAINVNMTLGIGLTGAVVGVFCLIAARAVARTAPAAAK